MAYAIASKGGNPEYNPAPANYYEAVTPKDSPHWWLAMCVEFSNMHDKTCLAHRQEVKGSSRKTNYRQPMGFCS